VSRLGKRRRTSRWARYFSHYGHIGATLVGGRAANRVLWREAFQRGAFLRIRRQAKHRFGERRPS
jgi:hypothetical protein